MAGTDPISYSMILNSAVEPRRTRRTRRHCIAKERFGNGLVFLGLHAKSERTGASNSMRIPLFALIVSFAVSVAAEIRMIRVYPCSSVVPEKIRARRPNHDTSSSSRENRAAACDRDRGSGTGSVRRPAGHGPAPTTAGARPPGACAHDTFRDRRYRPEPSASESLSKSCFSRSVDRAAGFSRMRFSSAAIAWKSASRACFET